MLNAAGSAWTLLALVACTVYDESLLVSATGIGQRGGASGSSAGGGGGATEEGGRGGAPESDGGGGVAGASDGGAAGVEGEGGSGDAGRGGGAAEGGTGNVAGSQGTAGTNGGTFGGGNSGAGSAGLVQGGTAGIGGADKGGAGQGGAAGSNLLFFDDFESGSASQWVSSAPMDFSVVTEESRVFRQAAVSAEHRFSAAGDLSWTDQIVEARIKVTQQGSPGSSAHYAALFARYVDEDNHYYVALRSDGRMAIRVKLAGVNNTIGSAFDGPQPIAVGVWYAVKLEVIGTSLRAYLNSVLYATVTDASIPAGKVAVGSYSVSALFDEVRVTRP